MKNIFFLFKHDKFLSNLQHYPKVFYSGKIMSYFYPYRIAMKKNYKILIDETITNMTKELIFYRNAYFGPEQSTYNP